MAEFTFIHKISVASLRDYIMTHQLDQGDSIVLNPHDFEKLIRDIKNTSDEIPDIPLSVLGVIVSQDSTDTIPIGKVQNVKNDNE